MREELITDRTIEDIEKRTAKGFYNLSDIQRICEWIEFLSSVSSETLDINLAEFTLGTRLTRAKIMTIIDSVNTLRNAWLKEYKVPLSYPNATPEPIAWDYVKANDLERIIKILWQFYYSGTIDKIYSGTFRAGNQIKFRSAK